MVSLISRLNNNVIIVAFLGVLFLLLAVPVNAGTNEKGLEFLKANKEKEGVITLPSGLQYKVLREGTGTSHPTVDSPCSCHYEGTLIDGTKFDSSYDRGDPTTFAPNQVIKGWTEAMQVRTTHTHLHAHAFVFLSLLSLRTGRLSQIIMEFYCRYFLLIDSSYFCTNFLLKTDNKRTNTT